MENLGGHMRPASNIRSEPLFEFPTDHGLDVRMSMLSDGHCMDEMASVW